MVFGLYPNALRSQHNLGSGLAKVETEFLSVYSVNSPKSEIVKVLKKADVVWVQMEIIGDEDKWCAISEEVKKASLGFVFCKDLDYLDHYPENTKQSVEKKALRAPFVEELGALNSHASDKKGNISSLINFASLLQRSGKKTFFLLKNWLRKGLIQMPKPNLEQALCT